MWNKFAKLCLPYYQFVFLSYSTVFLVLFDRVGSRVGLSRWTDGLTIDLSGKGIFVFVVGQITSLIQKGISNGLFV